MDEELTRLDWKKELEKKLRRAFVQVCRLEKWVSLRTLLERVAETRNTEIRDG